MKKEQLTETPKQADIERMMERDAENLAFEVLEMFEDALIELDSLPDILQILIRCYKLDKTELTEAEIIDLGNGYREIYSVLSTVQRRLWDIKEATDEIHKEAMIEIQQKWEANK